jgi:hypothetical protein
MMPHAGGSADAADHPSAIQSQLSRRNSLPRNTDANLRFSLLADFLTTAAEHAGGRRER